MWSRIFAAVSKCHWLCFQRGEGERARARERGLYLARVCVLSRDSSSRNTALFIDCLPVTRGYRQIQQHHCTTATPHHPTQHQHASRTRAHLATSQHHINSPRRSIKADAIYNTISYFQNDAISQMSLQKRWQVIKSLLIHKFRIMYVCLQEYFSVIQEHTYNRKHFSSWFCLQSFFVIFYCSLNFMKYICELQHCMHLWRTENLSRQHN